MAETPKVMGPDALLRQKVKQKRWREGYEEGVATTHRAAPAAAFVASATPVEMLGQFSQCAARQGSGKTLFRWFPTLLCAVPVKVLCQFRQCAR